jgi:intracellular sulfur oxidation DsrE/DsrF family protein
MIGRRGLGLTLAAAATPVAAAAKPGMPGESAFVEHRLALQISEASPGLQTTVINNAFNVLTSYGPDKVAIEIVTFAGGIDLLRIGNKESERIAGLVKQGVIFDACENTMAAFERRTGKPFPRNPMSRPVPSGVVHLITLSEHGYTIIRP